MRALDLAFLVPGLPFQGDTLAHASLGGSETAGLCLARELAALGHHVTVFSTTDRPGVYDDVTYRPLNDFIHYAKMVPHDVTIAQRLPEVFGQRTNSRLNVLWCHDLAIGRKAQQVRATLWNIDKVAVLSDFMAQQYGTAYQLAGSDLLWRTRNGIDLARFPAPDHGPKRLVFGARPERGLDVLLEFIFPRLLEHEPDLTLYLASYGNTVPHLRDFYEHCGEAMERLGPRCRHLAPMPKADYYRLLATASVYVYPTPSPSAKGFAEVSCITAMECQAVGLPIVSSRRGALPETIAPGAGTLIDGDPWTPEYQEAFVEATLRYVRDPAAHAAASRAGLAAAPRFSWAAVARQWSEDLERFILERNDSPTRLVQHLIRRSDVMAAKTVTLPPSDEATALGGRLQREWGFADRGPEALRAQYEQIYSTAPQIGEVGHDEVRFHALEQWLLARPEAQKILDFGCANGAYATGLANRLGRAWLGVDIDPSVIRQAEDLRARRLTHPTAHVEFRVGAADVDLADRAPFDALLACEVLEHVPDPVATLEQLERWVRPDGWVFLTVPYGPWEWLTYATHPDRAHLWEFDQHDLRDLFGKKKDLEIRALPGPWCVPLDEPLGWHLIAYRVDGSPTGAIDLARKRRWQRPRDTVSLVMIGGPGCETTLAWSLEPAKALVDQIVLGDCGLSPEARRIAQEHGALIVPASDPLETGFAEARNRALAHATGDWVVWWDTDERLIGGPKLLKYLRTRGYFTGYAIKQHNFMCDQTGQDVSTPVRCFRRTPRADGVAMRWHGLVHEHPEYALNEGVGQWVILTDVHVAHLGYLADETVAEKYNRNKELLLRDRLENPDRILQKHFLCRELMTHVAVDLKLSRGVVTPEITTRCREVLALYREHFLGKPVYLNTDTLQYYSRALEVLGEGVEVQWSWGADLHASTMGPTQKARFANYEECERELMWRLREAVTPQLSPWW